MYAFAFQHLHPDGGFSVIGLRKIGEAWVSHAYVSDGRWAFDHDGWTPEEELLAVTTAAEPAPGWQRLVIDTDLETFCREHSSLQAACSANPARRRDRTGLAGRAAWCRGCSGVSAGGSWAVGVVLDPAPTTTVLLEPRPM
jgi:hypothetical protein